MAECIFTLTALCHLNQGRSDNADEEQNYWRGVVLDQIQRNSELNIEARKRDPQELGGHELGVGGCLVQCP
jgi:hypothetical protein